MMHDPPYVFVHEWGAPHLVVPLEKILASGKIVHGDMAMSPIASQCSNRLWHKCCFHAMSLGHFLDHVLHKSLAVSSDQCIVILPIKLKLPLCDHGITQG